MAFIKLTEQIETISWTFKTWVIKTFGEIGFKIGSTETQVNFQSDTRLHEASFPILNTPHCTYYTVYLLQTPF